MNMHKTKTILSVLIALLLMLAPFAASVAEEEISDAAASTEARSGREIYYTGGIVQRGFAKGQLFAAADQLEVACMLAADPYVVQGFPSRWDIQVSGGIAPYNCQIQLAYQPLSYDQFADSFRVVDSFTQEPGEFTYTILDEGRYFWVITATDAAGQFVTFQTRCFETYAREEETNVQTVAGKVNAIIDQYVTDDMSDYRRAMTLHDWLINHADYDTTYTNYDASGVLLYGTGVCDSYSRAYQMLLAAAGVDSMIVTGYAGSDANGWDAHSWNLVKLGGLWYHIDCTWDDPIGGTENYDYFCLTDEDLALDHRWNTAETPNVDNAGMYVPEASGGVYSEVELTQDYDFAFSSIEEFEAGLDAQVAQGAYTPVVAYYTLGNVMDIQDVLMSSLSSKLQEFANMGLLSGSTGISMSGSMLTVSIPWAYDTSYIRINESSVLLSVGETVFIIPAEVYPAGTPCTVSCTDESIVEIFTDPIGENAFRLQLNALRAGSATVTVTTPSGLSDSFTVTVLDRMEPDFNLHFSAYSTGTNLIWDAIPGATQYELHYCSADGDVLLLNTTNLVASIENGQLPSDPNAYLRLVAKRVVGGETLLSYSTSFSMPTISLEMDLNATVYFDSVYTGSYYTATIAHLSLDNYQEISAASGWDNIEYALSSTGDDSYGSYVLFPIDNSTAEIRLVSQPYVEGDIVLTATARMGDFSQSIELPITVANRSDLTLTVPERIDTMVGESFALTPLVNGEPNVYLSTDYLNYYSDLLAYDHFDAQIPAFVFNATNPGISPLYIHFRYSNVVIDTTTCLFIADSEGNLPVLEPDIVLHDLTDHFYTNGNAGAFPLFYASIENLQLFRDLFGEQFIQPVWEFTLGTEQIGYTEYGDIGAFYPYVYTDQLSYAENFNATLSYTIGQEGDERYFTKTITIPLSIHEMPDLDLSVFNESIIHTQIGQTFTIDAASILPADWDGAIPEFSVSGDTDSIEFVSSQNGLYTYKAVKAGAYQINAFFELSNLILYPTLHVCIADENGDLPVAPALTPSVFWDPLYVNPSSGNGNFADVYLTNTWLLTHLLGNDYTVEWSASSANDLFSITSFTGTDFCYLYADYDTLTATGSEDITVTCTINDDSLAQPLTSSTVLTINVVESPIMAANLASIPDEVHLTTGDIWTMDLTSLLPENSDLELDISGYSSGFTTTVYGHNYREYQMLEPGIYGVDFYIRLHNHELLKRIIFYIADENGVVPKPEISLDYSIYEDTVYTDGDSFLTLGFFQIANFDDLCASTGLSSADFSVTGDFADGQHVFEFLDTQSNYGYLYMTNLPTTPGTVELTVTVAMGELTESVTFPITISDTAPVITLPRWINTQVGQETTVVPMYNGSENTTIHGDGRGWNGNMEFTESNEYNVLTVIPQEYGIWNLVLYFREGNLFFDVSTMLIVADENGVAPATNLDIVKTVTLDKVFPVGSSSEEIGSISIENFYDLHQIYGITDIRYSLSSDSDESLGVYEITGFNNSWASISMTQLPTRTGTVNLTLTVSAGEEGSDYYETRDVVFTIDVIEYDSSLYSVALPARVDAQVGQPLFVAPQISIPTGNTGKVFSAWVANTDILHYGEISDDGAGYIFHAAGSGITAMEVGVKIYNMYFWPQTMVFIADEFGNLPVVNIESYETTHLDKLFVDGSNYERIFDMSVTNMGELAACYGVDHVDFTLTAPNDERFGLYEFNSYNLYSDSVTLQMIQCPTVTGTFNLIVTATVNPTNGLDPISKEIVIPIQVDEFVPENFTVTLPDRTNAQLGVQLAVAPEITAPEGEPYRLYGTATAGDYLRYVFSQDGSFIFDVNNSGIVPLSVTVRFRNKDVNARTTVFIADENGTMPVLAPQLSSVDLCQPLYSKDSETYQSFAQITFENLNALREFHGLSFDPVWTVSSPEGAPAITTSIFDDYINLSAEQANLPVGTWDIQVDVALGDPETDAYYTGSIIVPLVIEEDPRTEVSLIPTEIETQIGQTFTISKLGYLPADWDTDTPISIEQLSAYDGLELVSKTDTEVTFRVISSGVYSLELFWQMNNLVEGFTISIIAKDENGIAPGSVVEVHYNSPTSETFYVGGTDNMLNAFHISNVDLLTYLYGGEPQWIITVLNAPDGWTLWPETGNGTSFWLYLDDVPMEPGSIDYHVECIWGEATYSQDFHLDIVDHPDGIPTGLNVQDEYYLQLGETLVLVPEDLILPAGFSTPGGQAYAGFGAAPIPSLGDFWDIFSVEYLPNNQIGLTPIKQGTYPINITWRFKNILISQPVTLYAANEAGEFISIEPSLESSSDSNVLYAGGNSTDCVVGRVVHENLALYNEVNWIYSDPVWSITASEGAPEFYLLHSGDAVSILTASTDMTPGIYDVTVSVELGSEGSYAYKKLSTTFSVEVLENPLSDLTGAGLPDMIQTQIGESFTVSMVNALPEDWNGPAPTMSMSDQVHFIFKHGDSASVTYAPTEPGVYPVTFFWNLSNLSVTKAVMICVADENGNVPDIDLNLELSVLSPLYIEGNSYHLGFANVDWNIYEALRDLIDSDPVFEIIESSIPIGSASYSANDFTLFLEEMPSEPCTVSFTIRMTWGDFVSEASSSFEIVHSAMGEPALNAASIYYMNINEPLTITVDEVLANPNWTTGNNESIFLNIATYGETSFWDNVIFDSNEHQLTFTITKEGVYDVLLSLNCANFIVDQPVLLVVADENGEVPVVELMLEEYLPEYFYLGGSNPSLGQVNPPDFIVKEFSRRYDEEPVFEIISSTHPLTATNYIDYYYILSLQELPTEPGDLSFTVQLTWGDHSVTKSYTIPIVPLLMGLPELNVPDVIYLEVGEGYTISPETHIQPENWHTGYGDSGALYIAATSETWEHVSVEFLDSSRILTGSKEGIYDLNVGLEFGNVWLSKNVTLVVTDSTGYFPLPENLFSLSTRNITWNKGGNDNIVGSLFFDRTAYQICEKVFGCGPEWFGPFDFIPTNNPACYQIALKDDSFEVGTHSIEIGFTWGHESIGIEVELNVVDPGVTLPESLNIPDELVLAPGEVYSITTEAILPEGWSINGENGSIILIIENEDESGLRCIDEQEDSISIEAVRAGSFSVRVIWICSNFTLDKEFIITVRESNLSIFAKQPDYRLLTGMAVQAELTGETERISTLTWHSNNENVASVDGNGVITALNEGEAIISVEATSTDGVNGSAAFTVRVEASARSMTLPAALTVIGNEAFYSTNAQVIYLPEGITAIGDSAFAESSSLWLIRIPASVTEIGNGILHGTDAAILCPADSPIAIWAQSNGIPCYILK